jgi:hypothetical protein
METPTKTPNFYPWFINNIDITFSSEETNLLQKGLKYKHASI